MFPFVTHQGSDKDVSFLGCAIQGTCRKSQLQIPCHMLSPLHRLYRSAIGLSVACLPLAISVVWSVWSVALWLSCGYGTRKKRVYPGIAAYPGQRVWEVCWKQTIPFLPRTPLLDQCRELPGPCVSPPCSLSRAVRHSWVLFSFQSLTPSCLFHLHSDRKRCTR